MIQSLRFASLSYPIAEEKIDEFLQHLSYSESSSQQRMMHNNSNNDNDNDNARQQQQNDDSSRYYFILQQLSAFISTGNNSKYQTTTDNNRSRPTLAAAAAAGNTGGTVSRDVYRLIWDASASLADSRPPANLCIYDKSGSMIPSSSSSSLSSVDNNNNNSSNENNNDPPIFDGSVANATPLPTHGGGGEAGSGTILHLACAMDRPLMLAFLLIMGADGRANHTAFRRLMVHEAACNGSINCLTLLLEMGHKYATKDTERKNNNNDTIKTSVDNNNNNCAVPFLPDDMDTSSSLTTMSLPPPRLAARPPPSITMSFRHFEGRMNNINTSMSIIGSEKKNKINNNNNDNARYDTDFLSVLQQFQSYTTLVNEGKISELQAACSLLDNVPILETTQTALIRSCSFRNDSLYANHSFLRPFGCADGHGNTPLHWASFKNEAKCVALLLHYNADPNARAHPSGWSPLHDAAYSNSSACIELLCEKGAQIDSKANSGATPLCFAAQEDASEAAQLLLERGADLSARCAGPPQDDISQHQYHFQLPNHPHSRFSGYTPLHYCAHYNAQRASHVLLGHSKAKVAMEVPDLSGRLPIHVAVARGSSDVLRALLHAGARVDVSPTVRSRTPPSAGAPIHFGFLPAAATMAARQLIVVPPLPEEPGTPNRSRSSSSASTSTSPVTSPVLRSMIPSQPISSSKPWNCLSQQAIDKCKDLILKSEQSWSPDHHLLFTPHDRKAIMELLRVGKRLEQNGAGIFLDLWPNILSFCGRGWFETEEMKLSYNDFENTGQSEEQRDIHRVESDDGDVNSATMVGDNFLALPRLED